jgi:hypothetical protein
MAVAPSWFGYPFRITRRVKKPPLLHQKINRSWDIPEKGQPVARSLRKVEIWFSVILPADLRHCQREASRSGRARPSKEHWGLVDAWRKTAQSLPEVNHAFPQLGMFSMVGIS